MKKSLLTLVLAFIAIANTWAYDACVDGIYYNLDTSAKTAKVTSGGNEYTGSVAIPSSIIYDGVTYSVTSIEYGAFSGCSGLTSITIPNSVTSIGESAFAYCSGLTSIEIPNSVTSIGESAFAYCSGLTSVTIPNSVTSIGDWAFYGCSGLTSVTIGNSVTSIGEWAFANCSGLTSIEIPNSVTSIGRCAFSNCSGLTSITVDSNNANYSSLDGVLFNKAKTELIQCPGGKTGAYAIPNSVTSIGESAFAYCYGLTSVTIPNSVTSIGDWAFYGCSGLTSVTIGNSVTSIGDYAFSGCKSLTSVTIPNSVTSIGNFAFDSCSGLTSITVDSNNANYSSLDGVLFNKAKTELIQCPGGKTGAYAIPNSVTSIGDYAFSGCKSLTSVTIPNSVTSIGNFAFDSCNYNGLRELHIKNEHPEKMEISEYAFEDLKNCTLYVPAGTEDAYGRHPVVSWQNFREIVIEK